jgi:RNA polymerase sporulation-specific sigma factor
MGVYGRAVANILSVGVEIMIAAVWLMLSGLLYSLQLSSGNFPKPLTEQEERYYLERSAQGDLEARNVLIERNLRLVAHIMKKYYANTSDQEDLISIGTIGLIKGITTFDPSKGARLATYAARCVENEILMHFRSQRKSSQDVSLSEIIETGTDGAALSLMDVVGEEPDLLESITSRERLQEVRRAVAKCLSDQEKQVVMLRFGIGGLKPCRQREVAEMLGISRSYVSRIEKRALQKLRVELEDAE